MPLCNYKGLHVVAVDGLLSMLPRAHFKLKCAFSNLREMLLRTDMVYPGLLTNDGVDFDYREAENFNAELIVEILRGPVMLELKEHSTMHALRASRVIEAHNFEAGRGPIEHLFSRAV